MDLARCRDERMRRLIEVACTERRSRVFSQAIEIVEHGEVYRVKTARRTTLREVPCGREPRSTAKVAGPCVYLSR